MKGDFSRLTGLKAKRNHYNGVLKQQGRVQLDSDWNELIDILSHQRKVRTIDTIGQCGAPVHDSGFQILHPGNGMQDLLFTSGRFYAGGLLCETSPSSKLPITGFGTGNSILVDDTKIDGIPFASPGTGVEDQWVQLITTEHPNGVIGIITNVGDGSLNIDSDISSLINDHNPYLRRLLLYSQQTDFPNAPEYSPANSQTDLLYLDVWERHITSIEDPDLREVALGGPDTDSRSKIIAQVKFIENVGNVTCEDEIEAWNSLIKPPDGRLTTRLVDPTDPIDPCQLGESGGFLGLENHLYRVEIHEVDTGGVASFKWSRDNAAFAYPINEFFEGTGGSVSSISLQQNGKDEILKIKQQDWIEVSEDETDLDTEQAGTLVQVEEVVGTILTLNGDVSKHKIDSSASRGFPKVRRWDISNQRPDVTTVIVPGTPYQLEDGIEVEFSGTEFRVGDYWVFSARVLTGEIELLDKAAPLGIKHHYCKLAVVTGETGGDVEIEDCRPEFPPLTELPPGEGGCCTVIVGEDGDFQDIQLAIDFLNGGPGTVCINPGVYAIETPILIRGNDITVKGCEGTAIIINTSEDRENGTIFQVQDSWDIEIHDLWCLSLAGAKAVEVENSFFFDLFNCLLVCGGASDLGGIVTCLGLTTNTRIADNILLGMIGIRYDEITEQSFNLHANVRVERNITIVLENGLLQEGEAAIIGLDLKDNLMMGISLNLLSKGFFPESLFRAAETKKMHDPEGLKKAKSARKEEAAFGSTKSSISNAAYNLSNYLKFESNETKLNGTSLVAADRPTGKPIIHFNSGVVDGNLSDNILAGNSGIYAETVLECEIETNLISAQQRGIEIGSFEGVAIKDNLIMAGTTAVRCSGIVAMNISLENNRLTGQINGLEFLESGELEAQILLNVQINKNFISAPKNGISLNNLGIFLQDFTAVDNSIINCEDFGILINVLDENQLSPEDNFSFQRVIQRNSISVKGAGISINVSDSKILDNEINIKHDSDLEGNNSRGILLFASNSTIANNSIQGIVNIEEEIASFGGIYLDIDKEFASNKYHQIAIHNNKIFGGRKNGIEIASPINGLLIEENQIAAMGLNGIAVQDQVSFVNDLRINGNHINDCHKLADKGEVWWKYAAIVLTDTQKTQINGNIICDNGSSLNHQVTFVGALYVNKVNEIGISDNQFLNNEVPGILSTQAAIHVQFGNFISNSDVRITDNLIKGSFAPALTMGNIFCFFWEGRLICFALDNKAVITNNHFESSISGPIIQLNVSHCIFASNYVSCSESESAVDLGYGSNVMANGNVISDPIIGAGAPQEIVNNLIF